MTKQNGKFLSDLAVILALISWVLVTIDIGLNYFVGDYVPFLGAALTQFGSLEQVGLIAWAVFLVVLLSQD